MNSLSPPEVVMPINEATPIKDNTTPHVIEDRTTDRAVSGATASSSRGRSEARHDDHGPLGDAGNRLQAYTLGDADASPAVLQYQPPRGQWAAFFGAGADSIVLSRGPPRVWAGLLKVLAGRKPDSLHNGSFPDEAYDRVRG
ncbi:hypothetical protein AAVH_19110 [Aphelenchoides avenae]|nr:hypothetical protein AAVH_19110 [Aphelenchus avenae]